MLSPPVVQVRTLLRYPDMKHDLPPRVLTIAGSDSGGGAGIQADLKTILAMDGYGMSAITALTAQNTREVSAVRSVPPAFVREQIKTVISDIGIDAAKTGMLHSAPVVRAVADAAEEFHITNLVVDPVMIAKSGAELLDEKAVTVLRDTLLPLSTVLTPNLPEARALAGRDVDSPRKRRDAAAALIDMGAKTVLIKGGHLREEPVDLFYDGRDFHELKYSRVDTDNTHGTGCTYSAAIATGLGRGMEPFDAVTVARAKLQRAIENALPLGKGHGPLDHRAMRDMEREQ